MRWLGIDPGQRHVGLCSLTEAGPSFHQIDTGDLPVLESGNKISEELRDWVMTTGGAQGVDMVCMERQLSVGGQSSSLLFHMQMVILGVIAPTFATTNRLAMPLPIQLQSYLKKRHGCPIEPDSATVKFFQQQNNWPHRISIHKVDAFYLAKLGQEVSRGTWSYNLPSRELPPFKGIIRNG